MEINFGETDYSILEGETHREFKLHLRRIQNPIVITIFPVNFTVASKSLGENFRAFIPDFGQIEAMEGI